MIRPLIAAIAWIGMFVTLLLFAVGESRTCRKLIDKQVTRFYKENYGAAFSGRLTELSFFPPKIIYAKVAVAPLDKKELWRWQAEKIIIKVDFFRYLLTGSVGFFLQAVGCSIYSELVDNQPEILQHLKKLLAPQKSIVSLVVTELSLVASKTVFEDRKRNLLLSCFWESSFQQNEKEGKLQLALTDGQLIYQGKKRVLLSGKVTALLGLSAKITAQTNLAFTLLDLPKAQQEGSLTGLWDGETMTAQASIASAVITAEGSLDQLQAHISYDLGQTTPRIVADATIDATGAQGDIEVTYKELSASGPWYWDRAKNSLSLVVTGPQGITCDLCGSGAERLVIGRAEVPFAAFQAFAQKQFDLPLTGTGICTLEGTLTEAGKITGTIAFHDLMVRLAQSYNCLTSLGADFQFQLPDNSCELLNLKIGLQKGTVSSNSIKVGFDAQKKDWFLHAPLVFSDCFVNWQKDLQADLSGALLLTKKLGDIPAVKGFVMIDSARLSENIFSEKTQKMLTQATGSSGILPITLDLQIRTRAPISIKTEQLETTAQLSLSCSTEQGKAGIAGEIVLSGGKFHFSAYSLPIIRGSLLLSPDRPNDPLIEIVAQGRIKKYLVTLVVAGSVSDSQILFESSPSLTQEQIMMLLIAGSEEDSLNIVVPALVMRNVENVIFGHGSQEKKNQWLEPLKRIRFVPRFTDQTGRGGFKGTLEIEVSKRLRAIIEKNFSLTEDVFCEVEYQVTDDMTFRVSRDERGDLGAEFEMRFKF